MRSGSPLPTKVLRGRQRLTGPATAHARVTWCCRWLRSALAWARYRRIRPIVCSTTARWLLEPGRCRKELKDLGVLIHSVGEDGEVNELMATCLAVLAEDEVHRLGAGNASATPWGT